MGTSVTVETPAPETETEPVVIVQAPAPEAPAVTLDLAQEVGRMGAVVEQLKTDLSEIRQIAESAKWAAENPAPSIVEAEPVAEIIPVELEPEPESESVDDQPAPKLKRGGLLDWIL